MDIQPLDEDYQDRMLQFEMDCNDGKGNAVACHQVGEFLSVVKNNHDKAAQVFQQNCKDLQHAPSCFNLGRMFLAGKGIKQSDAEAVKNFDTACKGDHRPACYHLGFLLLHGGDGFKQDPKKALKALESSCDGGLADGCHMLATQLLRKDGKGIVPRNPPRAKSMLEQGCEHQHGPSCFNLAVMYKNGDDGVPSDQEKFQEYKARTRHLIQQYGGLGGIKGA